jgi:uncharacterized protein YigA (DUF484 family)
MSDTIEKLGAHEVAAWLRRHPTFLQQFPDLALSLVVPREDGPAASLAEDFQGDLVRVVLVEPVAGLDEADWLQVIAADDARLTPFRDALADIEPICGRLHPDKNALLYGARVAEVQSSALLPLPGIGLLAVGSHEPNRFFPGMGTLFLRMMAESLAGALQRFDP